MTGRVIACSAVKFYIELATLRLIVLLLSPPESSFESRLSDWSDATGEETGCIPAYAYANNVVIGS